MRLVFVGKRGKRKLTPAEKQLVDAYGSELEETLWGQMAQIGIQDRFERQVKFVRGRKFLADFLSQEAHLIVEVDGGLWVPGGGGHNTGAGYDRDRRRDAIALMNGWRVLRVTSKMIKDGSAIKTIETLLHHNPCNQKGF